jgi:hypothetical protein
MSTKKILTTKEFSREIDNWYLKYTKSKYFIDYREMEYRISRKASMHDALTLCDLGDIAIWGGNQHGIKQRMEKNNTTNDIKLATLVAIDKLNNPAEALRAMFAISHWGLSYSSKTLRFMCPQQYPALDQKLRAAIDKALLPRIYDGNVNSMIKGYGRFIELCNLIKTFVENPGPRLRGEWFIADIEMGLFQFVSEGGLLV